MDSKQAYVDDGLYIEEVGKWAEQKYKHIEYYAHMFSTGMKNKWDRLVYVDLFSGSGISKIRDTDRLVPTSPVLALNTTNKFNRYIFCDIDELKLDSLRSRAARISPKADARFVRGDINQSVNDVLQKIPTGSRQDKVLSFCVVDPYNLGCLDFNTIRVLSERFIDFLVLIPSMMDANRNESTYIDTDHKQVDCFLGDDCWRDEWIKAKGHCPNFGAFLVECFNNRMQSLGYIPMVEQDFLCVRNPLNNSPLYHLGLFSRSPTGKAFWRKTKISSNPQRLLPFEMDTI